MSEQETPNQTPQTEPAPEVQTVPYERFAQKIEQVRALEAQIAEQAQQLEAVGELKTAHDTLTQTLNNERAEWSQKSALYQAGISDPEITELAQWRFQKSGSEDFGEWLKSAATSDEILKKHLNPPQVVQQTEQVEQAPAPVETKTAPNPNIGTRSAPPPRGELTPEAVQNMSVEELRANYGKIAKAWGFVPRKF